MLPLLLSALRPNRLVAAAVGLAAVAALPVSALASDKKVIAGPASLSGTFSYDEFTVRNNAKLTTSTSATLSWAASAGATSYEYCVSRTNGTCTSWISTGSNLSVSVTGLSPKTNYWWQVRAVNGAGTTLANAGSWWKFTTKT